MLNLNKTKRLIYLAGLSAIVLISSGCTDKSEEAYNSAIQNGLDVLGSEDYLKAEAYFELAIEEKPDSFEAKALLSQTTQFYEGVQLFENKQYSDAALLFEKVLNIEQGSAALISKSEKLINDITIELNKEEVVEDPNSVKAEELDFSKKSTNESKDEKTDHIKEDADYEDVIGIYALFESTPYESPYQLVEIYTEENYISGLKESSYSTGDIIEIKVRGNLFQLNYQIPETPLESGGKGSVQVELIEDNGQEYLYYPEADLSLYPITEQEFIDDGWSLPGVMTDSEGEESVTESEQNAENFDNSSEVIDAYNSLPLPLKVVLAATTVDERAMTPELLGFNLTYNFDENTLLINIHSGAGTGHPWYTLKYDNDTITPLEGVVYMGIDGYQDTYVDHTPVSKIDLYNRYMASKKSYDLALQNVYEDKEMKISDYEQMRSEIY